MTNPPPIPDIDILVVELSEMLDSKSGIEDSNNLNPDLGATALTTSDTNTHLAIGEPLKLRTNNFGIEKT